MLQNHHCKIIKRGTRTKDFISTAKTFRATASTATTTTTTDAQSGSCSSISTSNYFIVSSSFSTAFNRNISPRRRSFSATRRTLQELFNSVTASPLPETIFPTPPPIANCLMTQFKQGKNITLMKQMFHNTEPATDLQASSPSGLLPESLPNFEENIDYDDDDDDDDDEFQDENDEQKGFEQTIQLIKKGNIDREIKIMTQNKGNGTIQVYDAPTFSCIQNLQPFLKYYLRRKAIAEAQTRKLNRTLNTLISMSSKKA